MADSNARSKTDAEVVNRYNNRLYTKKFQIVIVVLKIEKLSVKISMPLSG